VDPGWPPGVAAPTSDQVRLLTKVARMYHERGVRQPQIAEQLHISQARVSRLLKQAGELGIVRVSVITPRGVFSDLEYAVEQRFGLREVVVADTSGAADEAEMMPGLGTAAAVYLETTLMGGDTIGISSWSSTLLATVDAMRPRPTKVADLVVQVLGGAGNPGAQAHATRLVGRLSQVTGAAALYLPAPGLVASAATRRALVRDPSIATVLGAYRDITVLLVGIGSLEPSALLRESGNAVAESEQDDLRRAGAVGDICLRFFDAAGTPVGGGLDDRVIGIAIPELRAVPRTVAVAGGQRKFGAIRAALAGGWVNVLVTDLTTAQNLLNDS
jgi:DNA-binding transcriptional regulator LsrR (DeoR family)